MKESEKQSNETPAETMLRWSEKRFNDHLTQTAKDFGDATTREERAIITQNSRDYLALWSEHRKTVNEITSHPDGISGYMEKKENGEPGPGA